MLTPVQNKLLNIADAAQSAEAPFPDASSLLASVMGNKNNFAPVPGNSVSAWLAGSQRFTKLKNFANWQECPDVYKDARDAVGALLATIAVPGAELIMTPGSEHLTLAKYLLTIVKDGEPILTPSDVEALVLRSMQASRQAWPTVPTEADAQAALDQLARATEAKPVREALQAAQAAAIEAAAAPFDADLAQCDAYANGDAETLPALPE